jgi:hypothetical protein
MKCRDCDHRIEVYLTGQAGIGLFQASSCGQDANWKLVEPDIDRECDKSIPVKAESKEISGVTK